MTRYKLKLNSARELATSQSFTTLSPPIYQNTCTTPDHYLGTLNNVLPGSGISEEIFEHDCSG